MSAETLARLQFGTTIVYHYLFVPLTLGLVLLVAMMETLYVRSGNTVYKRMTQFWGKLFVINFALGVVTGIVQEFQFGMNWSSYSRFIGDVIGSSLALETLLAFFLESTFLGIWLFGWDRLSKKLHLGAIWLVVLGSYLSTFWILVANSFMQHPVGYALNKGHAEMTNFWALITNPTLAYQTPHVVAGAITTGAFFIIGISAYHLLKKTKDQEFYQRSMRMSLVVALLSSIVSVIVGHIYGQYDILAQPMKMAAAEAIWNTQQPASLALVAIPNQAAHTNIFSISVPYLLSFLSDWSFSSKVEGINQIQAAYVHLYGPGNYIPDVLVAFYSFRIMLGIGTLMVLIAAVALFLSIKRKNLFNSRWVLRGLIASIALPYVANTCGWLLGEMGRQPWTIFGLLRTVDSVSPSVTFAEVVVTLTLFFVMYGILAVIDGYLLVKAAKKGSSVEETVETPEERLVAAY
ncbi:MAG: cytochrome ubiquinol oxidase subunit I [Ktedonobacteraceae bacterium]